VIEPAALQFVASAAGLLAGCEPLLLLASATDGCSGDTGALIDGESCARMSAAGFDPETELRLGNCVELLGSAGDLLSVSATGIEPIATAPLLILGLKWHAPAGH
jgi:glycerate-2-kinase